MKYDLFFSDIAAWLVGLVGLLAFVLMTEKALLFWQAGANPDVYKSALAALFLFWFSSRFVSPRAYQHMMHRAVKIRHRIPFIFLGFLWMALVLFAFVKAPSLALFGNYKMIEGDYLIKAIPIALALFFVFFVQPGIAFWDFRRQQFAAPVQAQNDELIRSNTSGELGKKFAEFVASAIIIGSGAIFFTTKTIPSAEYLDTQLWLYFILTLVLFGLSLLSRNKWSSSVDSDGIRIGAGRRLLNYFGATIACFGFAFLPYKYAVPWVYNKVGEANVAVEAYVVTGKVDYRKCRNGIGLDYSGVTARNFKLCSVDLKIHDAVQAGDTIFVRGPRSYFGHTADSISLDAEEWVVHGFF